jgi:hypothetical protein
MIYYDYLNFELVSIKTKRIDLEKFFLMLFLILCFFFTWKHERIFCFNNFFLKLCVV